MIKTVFVSLAHMKIGVSEHLIRELQIVQIGFQPLPFAREELAPFGAKPARGYQAVRPGLAKCCLGKSFRSEAY